MFASRALLSLLVACSALVAAAPTGSTAVNQCQGGDVYCCNSASDVAGSGGLLGLPIAVPGLGQCAQLSVLAIVLGKTCSATTACCQDVEQNGVVNLACTPIEL